MKKHILCIALEAALFVFIIAAPLRSQANEYCFDPEEPVECIDDSAGFDLWWCCPEGAACGTFTNPCVGPSSTTTTMKNAPDISYAWKRTISGAASKSDDRAEDVAVDASGDIFIAGSLQSADLGIDFTVIKLNGNTGAVIWRRLLRGTTPQGENGARALAVDNQGNVIAAGFVSNMRSGQSFTVVKLSGSDGSTIWHQNINGTPQGSNEKALGVTVDSSGDVFAAGYLSAAGTDNSDYTLVKLGGSTGRVSWRTQLNGPAKDNNAAFAIAVDEPNHIISAGQTGNTYGSSWITVVKSSKATGRTIWKKNLWGGDLAKRGYANTVALDSAGNVAVGGTLPYIGGGSSFAVIKLNGNTGQELWSQHFFGSAVYGFGYVDDIVIDAVDAIYAAGVTEDSGGMRFALMKLNGGDGSKIWPPELTHSPISALGASASSVRLGVNNTVIAAGQLPHDGLHYAFAVCVFNASNGQKLRQYTFPGTKSLGDFSCAEALVLDSAGNAIAAGIISHEETGNDMMAVKIALSGQTPAAPEDPQTTTTTVPGNTAGGCLVETACEENPEAMERFRRFRDTVLARTPTGRKVIDFYDEVSTSLAPVIEKNQRAKKFTTSVFDGIMPFIERHINEEGQPGGASQEAFY